MRDFKLKKWSNDLPPVGVGTVVSCVLTAKKNIEEMRVGRKNEIYLLYQWLQRNTKST